MALSVREEKVDVWRDWFEKIGGWGLMLYDAGGCYGCDGACLTMRVGCVCERCAMRLMWHEGVEMMFGAEMMRRECEERELKQGSREKDEVQALRRNRFLEVRRRWKKLVKGDVVALK